MTSDAIVLRGATVLTMDGPAASDAAARALGDQARPDAAGRRAAAIVMDDGRIVAVGSDDEVAGAAGPGATVLRLDGLAVLPGFVDAHAHPLWEGVVAGWPTLPGGPEVRAAMRALSGHSVALPPDDWLLARYDHAGWRERRHPVRGEVDRAVPDRPVVLNHVSGHAVVANSLALAIAGITADAPDRPDAVIERDLHGEPTGVITGPGAWTRMAEAMPRPRAETLVAAIARAGAVLAADGVTSVADADVGGVLDVATELEAWGAAAVTGRFPARLALLPGLVRLAASADADLPGPAEVAAALPAAVLDRIRLDRAKLFADGALSTRTAWLGEPYADEPARAAGAVGPGGAVGNGGPAGPGGAVGNGGPAGAGGSGASGGPAGAADPGGAGAAEPGGPAGAADPGGPAGPGGAGGDPAEMAERVRRAAHAGWAVATHAIGDAAIAATLDAYEAAGPILPDGRRHRIDHAMVLPDRLVERIAAAGVPLVLQPEFVTWAGDTYRARLGPERAGLLNRYASLLAAGVPVAFSSDRPVVGGAPLDGVRAALRHAGPSGLALSPAERPSVAEALRAWTAGAASAMDDAEGGVLAPGRRADLVVLSTDPTAVAGEAWVGGRDGVRVVATIVGGRLVAGALPGWPEARGAGRAAAGAEPAADGAGA